MFANNQNLIWEKQNLTNSNFVLEKKRLHHLKRHPKRWWAEKVPVLAGCQVTHIFYTINYYLLLVAPIYLDLCTDKFCTPTNEKIVKL